MPSVRTVDLFAGCGGMSLGFLNAGFQVVAAYDNWDPAIDVYSKNFDHPIFKLDLGTKKAVMEIRKHDPNLIIGGPPCQDFSPAGHRDETLGRANLTAAFANIVCSIQPRFFVMENVPRAQRSRIFARALSQFRRAGYGLSVVVLDASRCGVPQIRKRLFVIGGLDLRHGELEQSLRERQSDRQMTLFDYFGNSLGFQHYFRVPRTYQRRGVFSIHEPAMTVRGVDRPVPSGYPGHPKDSAKLTKGIRTLTQRERSLIQTFPPEFKLDVSKTSANLLVGNAVPVKLAEFVASELMRHAR